VKRTSQNIPRVRTRRAMSAAKKAVFPSILVFTSIRLRKVNPCPRLPFKQLIRLSALVQITQQVLCGNKEGAVMMSIWHL
jgi:hypothetical protein